MLILGVAILFWGSFALLFWTYFGYPLLMYVRAKGTPAKTAVTETIEPTVTMLIPTYNEADVIRRKLENSVAIDYPEDKLDIFVIDDDSTDGTQAIVEEFAPRVTLIRKPERTGKMGSVNLGMERATSDIVVLSDASPDYEAKSLRILVQPFTDSEVGVVVGTLAVWDAANAVAKPAGLYWRYEAALRKWETKTGNTVAVHGNMFAIRREIYRPITGKTINDEFSIAMETMQQGYRVVYEPDAVSYDDASAHMGDEFNRRVRINAGRYQALFGAGYLTQAPTFEVAFRLFSHKLLRPLAPIFMILMLVANVALATYHWFYQLSLLGQVGFYGAALVGWILERQGKKVRLLSVIYFFVSSNVAALFGLWRWLSGTQSVTWRKRTAETNTDTATVE
ncbi:MAG: glycosyltransferase family 2 protein [Chloroflexota bacterium]